MKNKLKHINIPDAWKWTSLGSISNNIMYGMNSAAITYDGIHKYIRITDIDESTRKFIPNPLTSPSGKINNKYKLKSGDIIFARTGASVGKSYLYNKGDGNLFFAGFLIRFSISEANACYVYNQTLQAKYKKWVKSISVRSGQPGINAQEYKTVQILLPPLPEQNRIVMVLETWDKYLEKLNRKIEIKKNIKKGLMQQLLTGKKRLKGISGKWQTVKLNNLGVFSKGAGIPKSDLSETGQNAIRYGELYTKHHCKIKAIHSFIQDNVILNTKKIKYGDILFAGSGETIDEIGKSAVYLFNEPCYVGGDIIIFSPKKDDSLFLAYVFNIGNCRKELRRRGQGQSVVHIYKKDLEQIPLKIPKTNEEQTAIANILTKADEEIESLEKKKEIFEAQKKYLLNNLITGNIRTPENFKIKEKKFEQN